MVILWDLDGTIQDSEPLAKEGTRHGFRTILGREPTEDEFAQLVGRPVPMVYKEWFGDELGGQILDIGSRYYKEQSIHIRCYDGILELLYELNRGGYRMGVVSSKRREFVFGELQSKGLEGLFEVIVGQEDTTRHKPHPDPLVLAMRKLNVLPTECVYIGDQPTDIRAAHAAGMPCIAALWGGVEHEHLQSEHPTAMAHEPHEILRVLLQNINDDGGGKWIDNIF